MPRVTATLKNVEFWRMCSARSTSSEERPSWAIDEDANGLTIATGPASTLAVAVATSALYPRVSIQIEVAAIYEVRLDGAKIEDIEPWLDEVMASPDGDSLMQAAANEAQEAILPYMREAVSAMFARTSMEVTALAPAPEHQSKFSVEVKVTAAQAKTASE